MRNAVGTVLVVNDDRESRVALCNSLKAFSFDLAAQPYGKRAPTILRRREFDVVLLNNDMPDAKGITACRAIRQAFPSINILMVTEQSRLETVVEGLDAGADDYVVKPFEIEELAARIRSAVRRARNTATVREADDVITVGDLELNTQKQRLLKAGKPIRLTPTEFGIMHYLMSHLDTPVSHDALLHSVWGPKSESQLDSLRFFVRELRKKIGDDARDPIYIQTEPYIGYRFLDIRDQPLE